MAFAELGFEAFEETDLLVGEFDGMLARVFLKAEEALVFGEEAVTLPDAADAAGGDVGLTEGEFLGDAQATMGGEFEGLL